MTRLPDDACYHQPNTKSIPALSEDRRFGVQQQQEVLEFVNTLQPDQLPTFDDEAWHAKADAIHAEILAKYGKDYTIDVQALLDEVREKHHE